ncbi:uncharacterized protein LOC125943529 [Dermacentor silvarum]|uniref:uncharacterized protein LOC125943529 n=1 Tax=Dermacentor silvarum TaxID=543639 RepID=UPI002101794D|nr:uncharacterized protein LOC125943529 [Dermacentor silvarum]
MSKSSVSEASTTSVGKIPTSLLWCRLFRPKISGCGCALLVLCATCFVAAVSINRGLLAWSSIFAAETVVPKGAIHQAGWRAVTRNITTTSVPTVRTRRPVASHASIAPAKQGLDRRRPRKVAAAERVRLDTEETEEEVVPPVVISTAVSGSNHEASGPHRRGTARAHHRRSRTVRSKSVREPPDDADEIFPEQETAMPTDLPSVARTPQDDGDENSLGTSSESDSGETVTESPETEMSGMPMTDMAQPSSPRDDNMPASADSSKITEFSAVRILTIRTA